MSIGFFALVDVDNGDGANHRSVEPGKFERRREHIDPEGTSVQVYKIFDDDDALGKKRLMNPGKVASRQILPMACPRQAS
ncbi:MAG: hypothetical protein MZU97_19385 [Bacillus subtilis]|nr:hypothetical protein [Bacillus subtilis]